MGVITYVALNLITGKAKEKKVSILMYVLAVLFIIEYVILIKIKLGTGFSKNPSPISLLPVPF